MILCSFIHGSGKPEKLRRKFFCIREVSRKSLEIYERFRIFFVWGVCVLKIRLISFSLNIKLQITNI